jgi:hypothetical protein
MMKRLLSWFFAAVALLSARPDTLRADGAQGAPAARVYELRLYTASAGRLADLQALFRNQGLRLFTKYGIENVFDGTVLEGAPVDGTDAGNMLVCILAHGSRAAADRAWTAFSADTEWQSAWTRAEQSAPLLAKPPVSIFMKTTDFSPALETPSAAGAAARVFELRKYNTGQDGLPRTVDQFQSGLAAIIAKNGMTPILYWTADDSSAFIYLLAHKDREAARASWASFITDYRPFMTEFNARTAAAPAAGAAPGAGTRRTPDDNRFLVPTDFSPRK